MTNTQNENLQMFLNDKWKWLKIKKNDKWIKITNDKLLNMTKNKILKMTNYKGLKISNGL